MKIKKIIVLIFGLVVVLIGWLSTTKHEDINEDKLATLLREIKATEISSISIRTQMTENIKEKVTTDEEDINKIVEFLEEIEGNKISRDEKANGWQFWILFEGYNITIIGDKLKINKDVYTVSSSTSIEFMKIYEEIKVEAHTHPIH